MAFRLKPQESVAGGLRRLVRTELRRARTELECSSPPPDQSIHEARKSIKKVRAIVQLLEDDGRRKLAGSRKRLRDIGRALSRLRDADAMVSALAKLRSRNPHVVSEHTFARLRRQLLSRKQVEIDAAERRGVWKSVSRELCKLRRRTKRWRPAHRGFRALARGLRVTHRRGRRAMARAGRRRRAADFHEWRKQIKTLWYELQLITGRSPEIRRDVQALHRAETLLGEDHNLVVLCGELSRDPSACHGRIEFDRLRAAADRYQGDLRQQAAAIAYPIYRRKSRDFVRRIKRIWKTDAAQDRAPHVRRPRRAA